MRLPLFGLVLERLESDAVVNVVENVLRGTIILTMNDLFWGIGGSGLRGLSWIVRIDRGLELGSAENRELGLTVDGDGILLDGGNIGGAASVRVSKMSGNVARRMVSSDRLLERGCGFGTVKSSSWSSFSWACCSRARL